MARNIDELNTSLKGKILEMLPEPGLVQTDIHGLKVSRREVANKIDRCFMNRQSSLSCKDGNTG